MTQDYVGSEIIEPDGYLEPTKFRVTCRCLRCGEPYSWTTVRPSRKDRPCPQKTCKQAALEEEIERRAYNLVKMLEEQRAPGHIGASLQVKAIDETARVVMEDHKLTDLKDNIRQGETMAPKLPPAMQAQADGFFGGAHMTERHGPRASRQMQALGRRAIAGAFKGMSINPAQVQGAGRGVEMGSAPIRKVGEERLK